MALAADGVLRHGLPRLPTGRVYSRGVVNSYAIAASFALIGRSDFAARLPSAIAGILLIPLLFLLGRAVVGPTVGLAAAGFVALAEPLVEWSRSPWLPSIFLLLFCAAAYCCHRGFVLTRAGGSSPRPVSRAWRCCPTSSACSCCWRWASTSARGRFAAITGGTAARRPGWPSRCWVRAPCCPAPWSCSSGAVPSPGRSASSACTLRRMGTAGAALLPAPAARGLSLAARRRGAGRGVPSGPPDSRCVLLRHPAGGGHPGPIVRDPGEAGGAVRDCGPPTRRVAGGERDPNRRSPTRPVAGTADPVGRMLGVIAARQCWRLARRRRVVGWRPPPRADARAHLAAATRGARPAPRSCGPL